MVVFLLNEPTLLLRMVLLLAFALCRVALGLGFLAADQAPTDFAAILGIAPLSFGLRLCGRQERESDRLHAKLEFGAEADRIHAMLECAGETDLPLTVFECVTSVSKPGKLLEVRSVGRSARVERVQRAEAGFKRSSCRASSSVDSSCDSLSATRVESPSSRVQRVNAGGCFVWFSGC